MASFSGNPDEHMLYGFPQIRVQFFFFGKGLSL